MGRCTDDYATINNTWELSWENWLLTLNIDAGIREFAGMGYRVENIQMTRTDKSQMMMSHGSRTSQLHKSITQTNRTK